MDGVVKYSGKIHDAKVAVKVIERHYEDVGNPPYIKYVCPVCEEAGLPHQLERGVKSCPICGVSLFWGMRRLNVTVQCMAVYNSGIDVPADLSFEEAIEYAKAHMDEIPVGALEYIGDSEALDEENCDFNDE